MKTEPYRIVYQFRCTDELERRFEILLDAGRLSMIRPKSAMLPPPWTRLGFKQCRCCPLDTARILYCPVAVNIAEIVEAFKESLSSEPCRVRCTVPERTYLKNTSLMEGISSVFGIIMATSGCPVMDFFRPMARFHLPFSTAEETTVRAVSMFLLRTYMRTGGKGNFPSAMKDLERRYARVQQVNEGLFDRITQVSSEDADKNAIIMLHSLSQLLGIEIDRNLDSIAGLFSSSGR